MSKVFLTKNGHGRFAIVDIRAYERLHTELDLMSALAEGEESARKRGWISVDSAMKQLVFVTGVEGMATNAAR